MNLIETELNLSKIEEKIKKLQNEHFNLMTKSQNVIEIEKSSQYATPIAATASSFNHENINNFDDEFYQLKFGSSDGQINYKSLFKFNKNLEISKESMLREDEIAALAANSFTDSFLKKNTGNTDVRTQEYVLNAKKESNDYYKSPILLKYSSYTTSRISNIDANNMDSKSNDHSGFYETEKCLRSSYDYYNNFNNSALSSHQDESFYKKIDIKKDNDTASIHEDYSNEQTKDLNNSNKENESSDSILKMNSRYDHLSLNMENLSLNKNNEDIRDDASISILNRDKLSENLRPNRMESAFDNDQDLILLNSKNIINKPSLLFTKNNKYSSQISNSKLDDNFQDINNHDSMTSKNKDRSDYFSKYPITTHSHYSAANIYKNDEHHETNRYNSKPKYSNFIEKSTSSEQVNLKRNIKIKDDLIQIKNDRKNNQDNSNERKTKSVSTNDLENKFTDVQTFENPYKSYKLDDYGEKNSVEKILDSEFLKVMDKKLKKIIKSSNKAAMQEKNIKESGEAEKITPIAWDISNKKNHSNNNNNDDNISICSSFITTQHLSHPYLPLREVPMHDIVKKLQREFELDGDTSNLPSELRNLWEKIKEDFQSNQNEMNQEEIDLLKSYFKNPIKEVIDKIPEENIENFLSLTGFKNQNSANVNKQIQNDEKNMIARRNDKQANIQELIRIQKQKHEKKLRILQKLTNLESMQLNKLMSLNEADLSKLDKNKLDEHLKDESALMDIIASSSNSDVENGIPNKKSNNQQLEIYNNENLFVKEKSTEFISRVPVKWFAANDKLDSLAPSKANILVQNLNTEKRENNCENNQDLEDRTTTDEYFDKKLSLQEAFRTRKYDLIIRSEQRLREIKQRSLEEKAKLEQQYDSLSKELLNKNPTKNKKDLQISNQLSRKNKYEYFHVGFKMDDKIPNGNKRIMSTKEIKNQTKKMYKKLPEVKQKELEKKMDEIKKNNRLKSAIFKKMIQRKVLMNGPNFNLSFRALENSIQ